MLLKRLGLFLLLLIPNFISAYGFDDLPDEPVVVAELIAEEASIQPGRKFWMGVKFSMADEWHIYWKHPGDVGLPTEIFLNLPDGFELGEIQWPVPKRFETQEMVVYGYEKSTVLMVEVTPPQDLEPGTDITLRADASWVACHEACLPGDQELELTLPVSRFEPMAEAMHRDDFAQAKESLPVAIEGLRVEETEEGLRLTWDSPSRYGIQRLIRGYFFTEDDEVHELKLGAGSGAYEGERGLTVLDIPILGERERIPAAVQGVLRLEDATGEWVGGYEISAAVIPAPEPEPVVATNPAPVVPVQFVLVEEQAPAETGAGSFILALLGAFLGGLLLNLMPCVMPVISLKILGFVKMAGKEGRGAYLYGLSFAAGVLVSFWILAGALIILQASGSAVGWGFQLQEPGFIAVMCFVLVLVGLNFFGVFEMGTSVASAAGKREKGSKGLLGAFSSGVLATALATPCTGPFLGTAIGFAATLHPLASLLIFTCIGLGMASPYLVLSSFPPLLKFLPKPGEWMITFKEAMGFVMLATVVWLLWVFTALTHPSAVFMLLAYLLVASFGAWIYGRWGSPLQKVGTRRVATSLAGLILIFSVVQSMQIDHTDFPQGQQTAEVDGEWQHFEEGKFQALRAEGVPVFIDFTARWCLICQANKIALRDDAVAKKMNDMGVARMEADWTRRDPIITRFLANFGRNGVPLYVLFPADPNKPAKILPQALTPDMLLDYLAEIE